MHLLVDNPNKHLPRARRSILFSLIAILCGIALPILIIEIALRFLPVASATATMVVDEINPIVRFTPNQPYTYSKGWHFAMVNSGRINNYGFINVQDYTKHDERGPLIIIGDSYVEAKMVPYQQTIQGRLATLLENQRKVYSMGISGAQLAQYLAFAQYAWTEFTPGALVFVIVGNDFDESLTKYNQDLGFYHFQEDAGSHDLKLVRTDYRPSLGKQLLRNSALVRYLWGTVGISSIPSVLAQRFENGLQYVGNTPAYASQDRLADSRRVVDRFFLELPQRVGLEKSQYLFIVDAMRPHIYSNSDLSQAKGSYFDLMRQYFLDQAKRNGYEAIDMQPRFISRHRRDGSRFEFSLDAHWNGLGHEEAADAIASSRTLEVFLSSGHRCDSPCAPKQHRSPQ
jgi:hypothetical protein